MRTMFLRTSVLAFTALLSACASTPQNTNTVGGDYLVYRYEGLPARGNMPAVPAARWTADEYQDLLALDASCRRQMEPQLPSAAAQIGKLGLRNLIGAGIGAGLGTGLGAIAAFTGVSFKDYALYGGLSGGGSGLGAGIAGGMDRVEIARRYAQYACMQFATNHTREKSGRLDGIGILPNAGASRARGVANPGGGNDPNFRPQPSNGRSVTTPLPLG